jgi:hypothetical protein
MRDMPDSFNSSLLFDTCIRKVALMHGLAQPSGEEIKFLFQFCREYLGGWSVKDIMEAASLNCAGKFENAVQGYGQLTARFIGELLHGLQEHRRNAPKTQQEAPQLTISDKTYQDPKEKRKSIYGALIEIKEELGEWPEVYPYTLAYIHLKETGQLQLTEEERKVLYDQCAYKSRRVLSENDYSTLTDEARKSYQMDSYSKLYITTVHQFNA